MLYFLVCVCVCIFLFVINTVGVWTFRTKGIDWCCGSYKSFQITTPLWIFLQEVSPCVNCGHTLPSQCCRRHRNKKRRWDAIGSTYSEYIFIQRYKCSYTAFWPRCSQGSFSITGNSSHWFACCKKFSLILIILNLLFLPKSIDMLSLFFLLKISWMCSFLTYMNAAYSFFFFPNRQRKGFQLLQENQKVRIKTRRRSIKSTKTRTRIRIGSTRSTSIVIKTVAKTRTRIRTGTKRKIKADIVIPVLITQRNTMKRLRNFRWLHLHCSHWE